MSTPKKFSIGQTFKRPGKCDICIFEETADGKYRAHKIIPAMPRFRLLQQLNEKQLVPGARAVYFNGHVVELISKIPASGSWNVRYADEELVFSVQELEAFEADTYIHTSIDPLKLVTRCERSGIPPSVLKSRYIG